MFTLNLNLPQYFYGFRVGVAKDGTRKGLVLLSSAVLDALDEWLEGEFEDRYSDAATAAFREWCRRSSVYYYGAPKDDFNEEEALDGAVKRNCRYVLLDNLS